VLLDGLYNVFGQIDFINTTGPSSRRGYNTLQLQGRPPAAGLPVAGQLVI
jgi:hypothetical protein